LKFRTGVLRRALSENQKKAPTVDDVESRLDVRLSKKEAMTTRSGARAAAAIPPLPLPPRRSDNTFLDASPLIESIAAVAPLPDAGSKRQRAGAIDVRGDGGDCDNSSRGVVAGAWLSADNSRGIAWEVEPEVG
jgi:hypothetical protein